MDTNGPTVYARAHMRAFNRTRSQYTWFTPRYWQHARICARSQGKRENSRSSAALISRAYARDDMQICGMNLHSCDSSFSTIFQHYFTYHSQLLWVLCPGRHVLLICVLLRWLNYTGFKQEPKIVLKWHVVEGYNIPRDLIVFGIIFEEGRRTSTIE